MSQYLEEAAALLRQAAKDNETQNGGGGGVPASRANPGRERIAKQFAELAAIDRGLIPTEMVGDLLGQIVRSNRNGASL